MVGLRNRWVLRATGIAAALLVWEVLGRRVDEALLAGPSLVLPELVDLVVDGEMPVALAGSLRQMLVGYALALAIGMPVGVAMGRSRLLDAVLRPWVNMLVVTSVASLVPLFIVIVGPMQKRGLDPEKLTFVEMPGSGTRMRGLLADRVDASLIHFDQAEKVAEQGNFKVTIEPHKEYPVWVNEIWTAKGDWLAKPENRRAAVDVLKATLTGFRRAGDDLDWFTDKYRKFASFKNAKDATADELRPLWETLRGPMNAWPRDMGFNLANFEAVLPAYKASGAIAGSVDLGAVIQTQYVEQALDELGG